MEEELMQPAAFALKTRCPKCGAAMVQEEVDGELCWVCPTPCGYQPIPVNLQAN